ncbi:MAG: site-2 protease family protein, partial [Candidatus Bathyarchaeia archaeon]
CRAHGMESSLPYFIPGPPPFGTFGAVVSLKSAPRNRDELFDTGVGGPLAGFVATLAVLLVDSMYRIDLRVLPLSQARVWEAQGFIQFVSWPQAPLIFYLQSLVTPISGGLVLMPSPLQFVVLVGALVTFLNILPIWQLDGGHISRAIWGPRGHRIASMAGLALLFVGGYWFFALFLLLLMFSSRRGFQGAEPLDDVSPLSLSRRLLYLVTLAILGLCFFIWAPAI